MPEKETSSETIRTTDSIRKKSEACAKIVKCILKLFKSCSVKKKASDDTGTHI